jgi:16S rRNA (cytosine967-C5)-methyltransferase
MKPRRAAIPASPRHEAVRQLLRIEAEQAFVGRMGQEERDVEARAERQVTAYVAGVTRWRRWLDFLLAQAYRGAFERMEAHLRQILRVGLYDLLFLHTPPHAAVHAAVALAKQALHPGAAALVNAVLRNLVARLDDLPRPDTGDGADDLAIRHSHPTWMVRRWLDRWGLAETEALLVVNNTPPTFSLRAETGRWLEADVPAVLRAQGIDVQPSPWLDGVVRTHQMQAVRRAGLLAEGKVTVQDEAAALVVHLLDPQPGETVVDACAAPGGKAFYAAARMAGQGRLLAFDVHPHRLALLQQAAAQRGITCIETRVADLRMLGRDADRPQADRVLLDVPCSGLGVLARRADLRWHRTEAQMAELTALQDQLLDAAAPMVHPGGCLVYSTCTIEPEENEQRVVAFLGRHPAFALEPAAGLVPESMVTPEGYYAALPHRHGTDGAFAARLRRLRG